jgi:hypothetical protein
MGTIDFVHGGVVTNGQGTMDIWVSYKKDDKAKERPIFEAVADPQSGIKEEGGVLEVLPSSTDQKVKGKTWVKRRCAFPNGSYLVFRIKRMRKSGTFAQAMHSFALQPRDSAPLIELAIELPYVAGRSTLSVVYIVGRFDVLRPQEVKAKKLHLNAQGASDLDTFDFAEMSDFVSLKVLEKADRAKLKPKLVTGSKGKAIARVRRPRRINLS